MRVLALLFLLGSPVLAGQPDVSRFNYVWNFNEGSGTSSVEAKARAYPMLLTAIAWVDGFHGKGIDTSATTSTTTTRSALFFPTTNSQLTISVWVKCTKYILGMIVSQYNGGCDTFMLNIEDTGNLSFYMYTTGTYEKYQLASTDKLPMGRWVHIVATFNTARVPTGAIYIDGIKHASATTVNTTSPMRSCTGPISIGMRSQQDGNMRFQGIIDEVAISTKSFSDGEVAGLFSATRGNHVSSAR